MAGLKEIRRRIASVRNTKQITRAMKLVSAAKLRRAQDDVLAIRSYNRRLAAVLATIGAGLPESFDHPLFAKPKEGEPAKPREVVVVSGDRGLCGAYNANIVKHAQAALGADAEAHVLPVGRRAVSTFAKSGRTVEAAFEGLGDQVTAWPIAEIGEKLMSAFMRGEISEVEVHFTAFVTALTQRPAVEKLLPLDFAALASKAAGASAASAEEIDGWRVKFDNDPQEIFRRLLPVYVRSKLLEAALESKASEHAARMTAMDSATRNADELIEKLRLYYNRARQSAITRDLIDIVSGAQAQV